MGEVFKALDARLGRFVALKFLAFDGAPDPRTVQRFLKEAQVASTLNHPNICTIYDVGECAAGSFIVMEYLEGESLRQRLTRGRLKPKDVLSIAIQAAEGLEAAHAQNVVHRDIKPENLFLVAADRLKILDFGLAKLLPSLGDSQNATHTAAPRLTTRGAAPGTLPYMSPEQARGEDVDRRTDLFSLGLVLYEMAIGRAAFRGRTAEIHAAILKDQPTLPEDLDTSFGPGLRHVLDRALEKKPELRYQHACDFAADLKRLRRDLLEGPVQAPKTAAPPAPVSFARRVVGDLLRAATVCVLALGVHHVLRQSESGRYLEQFQQALLRDDLEHGPLNPADFESGGRWLPIVVDLSALHADKRRPTDRRMLDVLIGELARSGASAVGIDLAFDDIEGTDLQYFQRWAQQRNVRIGIYRRATERRDAWLGTPDFAELAAGIGMPTESPQQAFAFTRRWTMRGPLSDTDRTVPRDCRTDDRGNCKDDLYQLPVALWLLGEHRRASFEGQGPREGPEARLARQVELIPLGSSAHDGTALEAATYAIDYSFLKELRRDIVTLAPGSGADTTPIAAQIAARRSQFAERMVLVGDLEDTSDHLCYTPRMNPLPGVLVHACALATWNRQMLLQPSALVSRGSTWLFGLVVAVAIVLLRAGHAFSPLARHIPHQHLETFVFSLLGLGVVFGARWLARTSGVAWSDYFWVAGGLMVYAFSEPLWRSFTSVPRAVRLGASGLIGTERGTRRV